VPQLPEELVFSAWLLLHALAVVALQLPQELALFARLLLHHELALFAWPLHVPEELALFAWLLLHALAVVVSSPPSEPSNFPNGLALFAALLLRGDAVAFLLLQVLAVVVVELPEKLVLFASLRLRALAFVATLLLPGLLLRAPARKLPFAPLLLPVHVVAWQLPEPPERLVLFAAAVATKLPECLAL